MLLLVVRHPLSLACLKNASISGRFRPSRGRVGLGGGRLQRTTDKIALGDALVRIRQARVDLAEDQADIASHRRQDKHCRSANQHQQQRIFDDVLPGFILQE